MGLRKPIADWDQTTAVRVFAGAGLIRIAPIRSPADSMAEQGEFEPPVSLLVYLLRAGDFDFDSAQPLRDDVVGETQGEPFSSRSAVG
jgi:hypothetical protein